MRKDGPDKSDNEYSIAWAAFLAAPTGSKLEWTTLVLKREKSS